MKNVNKLFLVGCGVVILLVVLMNVYVFINNKNSGTKELVCLSNNGNVTITYDKETIIGYTSNGYAYDLLSEKSRAEEIGINKYIEEFSSNFNTYNLGTCTK